MAIEESADNYHLFAVDAKLSKWIGYPDANYSFEGSRLSYERLVEDEDGKEHSVKTYREPIEIVANFETESKVLLASSEIEVAVAKTFGPLKGFVWLEDVDGEGEIVLPFTAPNIFIATGDYHNPILIKIGTDPNEGNYYELVKEEIDGELVETGKTRVFMRGFSGAGGAGERLVSSLIAWYKMNENAPDNDELVAGGAFSSWPGDNPAGWSVTGESGNDPEVSEAAAGESHADTPTLGGGMCNIYSSDGTDVFITQQISCVIGRKYAASININTVTTGGVRFYEPRYSSFSENYSTTGIKTITFVAMGTIPQIRIRRNGATDVTFDDVSVKLCTAEDSSGNDHDMCMQQDTNVIHRDGRTNGAFAFNGTSDFGEIADHDDFTPALAPFSINTWVYMHDATNFKIASKSLGATNQEWRFGFESNNYTYFWVIDDSTSGYRGVRNSTSLTSYENQWIMLTATYDGGLLASGCRIYLNALRIDDVAFSDGTFSGVENLTAPVHIGRYDTLYANGLIDNVTFFNKELTAHEVSRLYMGGRGTEVLNMRRWGWWR